jgi:hypothetical protein
MKCLALILAVTLLSVLPASADSAMTIIAGGRPSSAIVPAGTVRGRYKILLYTVDSSINTAESDIGGSIFINLADAAGNIIHQEQYPGPIRSDKPGFFETNPISFEFNNPVEQAIQVMVVGAYYYRSSNSLSRIGLNFFVTEPDNRLATRITVDTGQPPEAAPPPNNPPPVVQESGSRIHAVIVSGRSAPEQVLRANGKTTLYGGLIALGPNDDGLAPVAWPTGLLIVPDPDLLSGAKIPPIIPNIADVRIRHYSVEATMESAPALDH